MGFQQRDFTTRVGRSTLERGRVKARTWIRGIRHPSVAPADRPRARHPLAASRVRWVVVAVLTGHGLIHLLGVAKGFGWAEVSALEQPISPGGGVVWLLAAVLVLASAVLIAAGAPTWWWAVAVLAAVVSEVAIATSWSDAKFGTAANLVLVLAAVYGFASLGPTSFHAQFRDQRSGGTGGRPRCAERRW